MKTAILGLIGAIVAILILVVALIATVFFGYAVGLLIVAMPFVSGVMVGETAISPANIPVYTAWIAVAAVMFRALSAGIINVRVKEGETSSK